MKNKQVPLARSPPSVIANYITRISGRAHPNATCGIIRPELCAADRFAKSSSLASARENETRFPSDPIATRNRRQRRTFEPVVVDLERPFVDLPLANDTNHVLIL